MGIAQGRPVEALGIQPPSTEEPGDGFQGGAHGAAGPGSQAREVDCGGMVVGRGAHRQGQAIRERLGGREDHLGGDGGDGVGHGTSSWSRMGTGRPSRSARTCQIGQHDPGTYACKGRSRICILEASPRQARPRYRCPHGCGTALPSKSARNLPLKSARDRVQPSGPGRLRAREDRRRRAPARTGAGRPRGRHSRSGRQK